MARNPRMGDAFTSLHRAGTRAVISRRRRESELIPSRDPERTSAEEVSIPPREAEAAAALATTSVEFTAVIISGIALAAATVWMPSLPPRGTNPQAFDPPPPPPGDGKSCLEWRVKTKGV